MTDNSFTRYLCWDKQPISRVINKEAVSIDRTLFLSTHAPFTSIRYETSPYQMTDTSETNLLAELQQRATDDQHTFMVIQGIPGTGKSHLIRWLKERYSAENEEIGGRDIVLLIERANSSLRQTLTQIIESGLFNAERFSEQLRKLAKATDQLSNNGLADTILNNLQVATREVKAELPRRIKRRRLEKFLLDYFIREELKKEGGPIDRIMRFLSGKDRDTLHDNELPTFKPEDFEISVDVRYQIRNQGYGEAKDLAEKLANKPKYREDLVAYLNQLVSFAVQRTTALSATDLKHMFDDLRRELKLQGKELTLFIEDIAVFTGLDAGLIDALVTQHTGESNREFCRLTSVVGITDNYYLDSFPDNIKQRVTHHLTLNSDHTQQESQLLATPAAVADLVARYLNVMRLPTAELEEWAQTGAKPDALPNACLSCAHRSICHPAFGHIALDGNPEHDPSQVGLYPFNENALWTMYNSLDTSKVSKTPRTLLNSVVEYVLVSHGSKVKDGLFPPIARSLGSDFEAPILLKPTQRRVIRNQSRNSSKADRIESLILFWGNRTVDQTTSLDGQRQVGGLQEAAFKAFDLPFIEGEATYNELEKERNVSKAKETKTPFVYKKQETSKEITVPVDRGPERSIDEVTTKKQSTPPPPSPPTPPSNPLLEEIERWRTGDKLKSFQDLTKWLANFAKEAIDWQAHHISTSLVDHCFRNKHRFSIEGQSGQAQGDRLLFKRSDELAYVLHALTELQQSSATLAPQKIGIHLYTLSNWLRKQEARIVEFVRQPTGKIQAPRPLEELLVHNCLLIACLSEELLPSQASSRQLYLQLLKEEEKQKRAWETVKTQAKETRSDKWLKLMRAIEKDVADCRHELLVAMNHRQGTARTIIYMDAPRLLDLIDQFKKQNWASPQLDLSEVMKSRHKTWVTAAKTYQVLQQEFVPTLVVEQKQIQEINQRLKQLMGEDSPKEVFSAISDLLSSLRENQISHSFTSNRTLTDKKLSRRLSHLEAILAKNGIEALALSLSGAGQLIREVKAYRAYLEEFLKLAKKEQSKLGRKMSQLEGEMATDSLYKQVEGHYQALDELLISVLQEGAK